MHSRALNGNFYQFNANEHQVDQVDDREGANISFLLSFRGFILLAMRILCRVCILYVPVSFFALIYKGMKHTICGYVASWNKDDNGQ